MNYKKQTERLCKVRNEIAYIIEARNDFDGIYTGRHQINEFKLWVSLSEIPKHKQIKIEL